MNKKHSFVTMSNFNKCLTTDIYDKFRGKIMESNFLDSNDDCIVTIDGVYYAQKSTSAGSVVKGYFGFITNPKKYNLFSSDFASNFQNRELNFVSINELHSIADGQIRTFAKTVLDRHKSKIQRTENNEKIIAEKLERIESLKKVINECKEIEIPEISDFKKIITEHETDITSKGGDEKLFAFLKIDSFLKDFRNKILSDKESLQGRLNFENIKDRIVVETNRQDLNKVIENFEDISNRLSGKAVTGFDALIDNLFDYGDNLIPTIENQVKTMLYYKEIATAMVVFYLHDKKIRYFEIYEAFDKLGVFNTTWQQNVLNKLESIDMRLSELNDQLTELNTNFQSLVNSSNEIVDELKQMNSSLASINLFQAITTFQTWRINRNTSKLIG